MVGKMYHKPGRSLFVASMVIVLAATFLVFGTGVAYSDLPNIHPMLILARNTPAPAPAPSLSVSPSPAISGQTVQISGQHFSHGQSLSLFMKPTYPGAPLSTYAVSADGNGAFTYSLTVAMGQFYIYAQDSSGSYSNQLILTVNPTPTPAPTPVVTPSLSVSPSPATAGQTVQISGQHFSPGKGLSLFTKPTYPGAPATTLTATADVNGAFTYALTVNMGQFYIYAQDSSGRNSNQLILTVNPMPTPYACGYAVFICKPEPCDCRADVQISGQHFSPGKGLSLFTKPTYPGAQITTYTVTADNNGAFTYGLTVAMGQFYIYAQDSSGSYSNQLTLTVDPTPTPAPTPVVTPSLSVSPSPATAGQTIQINGQHFSPGKDLSLFMKPTYPGAPLSTFTVSADGNGAFTYALTVAMGQFYIYSQDISGSYSNQLTLTVNPMQTPTAAPGSSESLSLSVSPNPATVGQTVQISGQHFSPGKDLTLFMKPTYPGAPTTTLTVSADGNGAFVYVLTAQIGHYYIYARDSSGNYSSQEILTVNPATADESSVTPGMGTVTPTSGPAGTGATGSVTGETGQQANNTGTVNNNSLNTTLPQATRKTPAPSVLAALLSLILAGCFVYHRTRGAQ